MLSLERQNGYRARYKAIRPGWRTSGEIYEALVRQSIDALACAPGRRIDILDLGCGAGGLIERVSQTAQVAVGVDCDLRSLARHRGRATRLAAGRLEQLPFGDRRFDIAISSWVLEHLACPQRALAEIARVLKPGGRFIFLTPNASNLVTRLNRLTPRPLQARLVSRLYGRAAQDTFPLRYRANTLAAIDALARSAGLRRIDLMTVGDPTYLAFNDWLFSLSVLLECNVSTQNYVHIVGHYVKEAPPCAAPDCSPYP